MKTFFKILGFLAMICIAMVSCSESFLVFVEDGKDGIDGVDGKDGKDGNSVVSKIDTVFSNLGEELGFTASFYQDNDGIEGYSAGDEFQNSFTIFHGSAVRITMEILPPSDDCPTGTVIIQSHMGAESTGIISYCIPEGSQGEQGESGYNLVAEYFTIVLEFYENDRKVFRVGTEAKFYWDIDRDGEVSEEDEYKGGFIVWNGNDGHNGIDGRTPTISLEVVDGYLVVISKVDAVIIDQVTIKLPEDGVNGMTPSLHAINFISHWDCDDGPGIMYIWYFDYNGDGIDQPEEVISDFVLCGGDSEPFDFTPLPTISYDFNNKHNTPHHLDEGFKLSEGLSGNILESPNGNGTIELHDHNLTWAEFYTPEFSPSAITAVELSVGSRNTWTVELLFIRSDGTAEVVHTQIIQGKSDVVWYKNDTYGKPFTYYVSLDKIEHSDVVRVGFRIHKHGEDKISDKNYTFNGDNLRIARVIMN
jgi:hypothetical protein